MQAASVRIFNRRRKDGQIGEIVREQMGKASGYQSPDRACPKSAATLSARTSS